MGTAYDCKSMCSIKINYLSILKTIYTGLNPSNYRIGRISKVFLVKKSFFFYHYTVSLSYISYYITEKWDPDQSVNCACKRLNDWMSNFIKCHLSSRSKSQNMVCLYFLNQTTKLNLVALTPSQGVKSVDTLKLIVQKNELLFFTLFLSFLLNLKHKKTSGFPRLSLAFDL